MTAQEVAKLAQLLEQLDRGDKDRAQLLEDREGDTPGAGYARAYGSAQAAIANVKSVVHALISTSPLVRTFGARAVAGTHNGCGGNLIPSPGNVLWCDRCGATGAAP